MSAKLSGGKTSGTGTSSNGTNGGSSSGGSSNSATGIQKLLTDNLVEKITKMALPPSSDVAMNNLDERRELARDRPSLSVNLMSRNFRQMNARLSQPFTLIDEVIKIFSWTNPAYTISIMLIYTHAIMKPVPTLTSLPIFSLLFGVMVPRYLYIHKPNACKYLDRNPTPAEGPPLKKPLVPKPVPELSQEFVLNLTDLQNHMMLYVYAYDFINQVMAKFAYFTNEKLSTAAFLFLLTIGISNVLFVNTLVKYLPVKAFLLAVGWFLAIMTHPKCREQFFSTINSEETRIRLLTVTNRIEKTIYDQLRYVEAREQRLVRVYEIQKFSKKEKGWLLLGFSNDDYTLFSDLRISEQNIIQYCAPSLEEVKPPLAWEWAEGSAWALDLDPVEWVERNFIQCVDIDLGTKWVYDLTLEGTRGEYRRRMWTNLCVRQMDDNTEQEDDGAVTEEVISPLKHETYAQGHRRVSRGSMSGSSHSEDAKHAVKPVVKRSGSHNSDENMSSPPAKPKKDESYGGLGNLTDLLNMTV
ncbi:related to Peroxisomal membrane protein PEX29 [Zygosaccharomyces bailii ISA1307]|nr:related to Peroxisomal membrane protein PEX29 [Zygosaccharomyces bailii ISA1307]